MSMRLEEQIEKPDPRDLIALSGIGLGSTLLSIGIGIALGIGWGIATLGAAVLTVSVLFGRE